MNVWWEVLVLVLSLNRQEGDTLSKKKKTNALSGCSEEGCEQGFPKVSVSPLLSGQMAVSARTTSKDTKAISMQGASFALEKRRFESCLCHRLPTWLAAQLCARDVAVPYPQGYFRDEHVEDRTSQTIFLAPDTVLAEQTRVTAEEWRWKLAFWKIRG